MTQPVRIEHDLLGDRAVPADAYYGVHTLRALENFAITGTAISIYRSGLSPINFGGRTMRPMKRPIRSRSRETVSIFSWRRRCRRTRRDTIAR